MYDQPELDGIVMPVPVTPSEAALLAAVQRQLAILKLDDRYAVEKQLLLMCPAAVARSHGIAQGQLMAQTRDLSKDLREADVAANPEAARSSIDEEHRLLEEERAREFDRLQASAATAYLQNRTDAG